MSARRIVITLATCFVVVAATTVVGYAAYVRSARHLLVVEPGAVYRSGPIDRTVLEDAALREGLRTVFDVGTDPLDPAQMSIVHGYGLRYVRFPILRGAEVSLDRMAAFAEIVSELPQPILVRCSDGIAGSQLAAALLEVAVMGRMPEQAWLSSTSTFERLPLLYDETGPIKARFDEFVSRRRSTGNSVVAR